VVFNNEVCSTFTEMSSRTLLSDQALAVGENSPGGEMGKVKNACKFFAVKYG
jgi:hypothetical protein